MAGWLNTLEGSFTQQQLDSLPERIVVVGSCYSGTFISPLSKHGRVIISSAAPTEESARGFIEGDGVMTGEYFVDQLFVRLERGDTFKDAFNAASRDTAMFTRAGTSLVPDPTIIYHDTALQHPLLDDNGDHAGLNQLPDAGTTEGQLAATIRLGIGRQAQISPSVEIVNTTDTIYLTNGQSGLPNGTYLWVELNDPALMNGVPVVKLRSPTTATSGGNGSQITYSLAELQMSTIGTCTRSDGTQTACYHTTDSQSSTGVIKNISVNMFSNPGIYEAYYYAIDKTTLGLSPIRRSVIYKSDGTTIPAPVLVSPGDGTPQKTALVFEWNPVPVATKKITYTLEISTIISGVSTIVHRLEELVDPMVMIPMGVLKDLTTYDWKVSAIDQYGNKGISYIQSFTTNNRNGLPTMIKGYVTDSNGAAVVGATVSGGGSSTTTIAPYGAYLLSTGSSGSVPITASKLTYADQQATASLTPGGVSIVSFRMASNNYLLSVTINGSGTGTVYSTSPSIGAPKDIACATADPSPIVDCQATYPSNSSVTLYPALSWYSKLSSWSGGGCSVAGDCIVPMSSPQSVTATIDQAEFVKLANPAGFYGTIQGAYDKATLGGEIKLRDSSAVTFLEPLIVFNQNYTVTLDGGNDFGWVNSGYSVVKGVLKIQAGRVTVKNLKIMP
jgi:hypothetical protein